MEKENQNNDHVYRESMWNDTKKRTVAELHEAMIKSKEQDFEEDWPTDLVESELDYYNL